MGGSIKKLRHTNKKYNYAGWDIKPEDFPITKPQEDQLKFILKYGILAPSGHNSQPWYFSFSNNKVNIHVDKYRSLSTSDPLGRQLHIALGCLIENILIAADYFGYFVEINLINTNPLIELTFNKVAGQQEAKPSDFILAITRRHTNRGKYEQNNDVPPNFLVQMQALNDIETKVVILTKKEFRIKNEVLKLLLEAQVEAMGDKNFRNELSHFVVNSYTKKHYGMPGFTLEIPGIVSVFAPKLIKKINLSKLTIKQDSKKFFEHTPAVGIVLTKEDSRQQWVKAGRIFEHSWLIATKLGLTYSPLAAATQIKAFSSKLQELLQTPLHPVVAFRVGFPESKKIRHSPRFMLEDLIIPNDAT